MKAATKFWLGRALLWLRCCARVRWLHAEQDLLPHDFGASDAAGTALHQRMRVSGNVRTGSIAHRTAASISSWKSKARRCR